MDPGVPRRTLSTFDAMSVIIGIVIGAGIFKTPSLVAEYAGTTDVVLLLWFCGGIVSFVGALCYAELTSAYPHAGGDYHYLSRAFGKEAGFLFAWARMLVIQTGSIAMLAFLVGDYASEVFPAGMYSTPLYASLTIVLLTVINIFGLKQGKTFQNVMTGVIVMGLFLMSAAGLVFAGAGPVDVPAQSVAIFPEKAMIFVLLTYGGWNEAAYISAEVRDAKKDTVRALLLGIAVITAVFIMTNFVFMKAIGLVETARSGTVAAELMRKMFGEAGAIFISILVVVAALSTMNGSIITGARSSYAVGRDFRLLSFLAQWRQEANTPAHALLVQAAIALALVALGSQTRSGFATMIEYTAPVFWFFFLLVGISLIVLRLREPGIVRPFRVPLYPLTPLVFCGFCIYMLRASILYTGTGALAGVALLLAGIPVTLFLRRQERTGFEERWRQV